MKFNTSFVGDLRNLLFGKEKKKSNPFPLAFYVLLMVQDSPQLPSTAWNTKVTPSPALWECDSGFAGYLGWGRKQGSRTTGCRADDSH